MSKPRENPRTAPHQPSDAHDGVNLRPGQTDEGGHGGMATREQKARLLETQGEEEKSTGGSTPEPPD